MSLSPANPSVLVNTDVELTSPINNALWSSIPSLNTLFSAGSTTYKKKFQASVAGSYTVTAAAGYSSINAKFTQLSNGDLEVNVDFDGTYPAAISAANLFNVGEWFEIEWVADSGANSRKFQVGGGGGLLPFAFATNFVTDEAGNTFNWSLVTGDIIRGEIILDGSDKKLKVSKNGVHQVTFARNITVTRTLFYQPYLGVNTGAICKPIVTYLSDSTPVTVFAPVSVSLSSSATSINYGQNITITATPADGSGTKTYKWYLDTVEISGETSSSLTINTPSLGSHTVKCEIADSTGTGDDEIDFFVGQITGASNVQNGATALYSTNVPNPVFLVQSGGGSFDGNEFEADGVGSVTLKATNSLNTNQYSTKPITVYEPAVALFSLPDEIVTGQSFSTDNESEGTIVSYKWELNNVQVGTSENVTLNLGIGDYELKLTITDAFGFDSDHTETFTVLNVTPVITSKSPLPYARIGNLYEYQFQVSGGSGSGIFSLEVEGNLPENSVSFSGLLSIAEVGDEDYSFILKWEDADGRTYTKAFTIPVSELAYISFCHKRPLRKKRLLSQEIFENLDGSEDVAEWREMKWEYFMNSLYIRNVERDELHNFLTEHRNRTPFLWHNPDRDEIKIVKITEFGEDNEMLAYGDCSFTLRDV